VTEQIYLNSSIYAEGSSSSAAVVIIYAPTNAKAIAGERQYEQHALQHLVALSSTPDQPDLRDDADKGQGGGGGPDRRPLEVQSGRVVWGSRAVWVTGYTVTERQRLELGQLRIRHYVGCFAVTRRR
jgi:hypothetical protein